MTIVLTVLVSLVALAAITLLLYQMVRTYGRQRQLERGTILMAQRMDDRCRERTGISNPNLSRVIPQRLRRA